MGHYGLLAARLRRSFYDLRTEHTGTGREAAAIGLGVFIGCTPLYGFHLLMCWAAGRLFRLNRLQVYLAANISNPAFAPLLILAELETGSLLHRGTFLHLTLSAIRGTDVRSFGLEYLIGAVVIGLTLGTMAAATTYAVLRGFSDDEAFTALVKRASDRYMSTSITAWEFSRGKLRGDPVYRHALYGGLLPTGGTLVDVGCGKGLMLALLAEARSEANSGPQLATSPVVPRFERLIGIESRSRVVRLARAALETDAEIVDQDARLVTPPSCCAVLLFDVLHLMSRTEQEALVTTLAGSLEPGGVILVRDADASAGWRFSAVRIVNWLKALIFGLKRQPLCFRTEREWLECFDQLGLDADVRPMGDGTPFANVLFRLKVRPNARTSRKMTAP